MRNAPLARRVAFGLLAATCRLAAAQASTPENVSPHAQLATSASRTSPTVKTTLSKASIAFEKYLLPNGLTVLLHADRSLPLVAVNVWYHVGPANEPVHR